MTTLCRHCHKEIAWMVRIENDGFYPEWAHYSGAAWPYGEVRCGITRKVTYRHNKKFRGKTAEPKKCRLGSIVR